MGKPADWFDHVTDRAGHDLRYAIDATKLRDELGWAPRYTDLRAGLDADHRVVPDNRDGGRRPRTAVEARYAEARAVTTPAGWSPAPAGSSAAHVARAAAPATSGRARARRARHHRPGRGRGGARASARRTSSSTPPPTPRSTRPRPTRRERSRSTRTAPATAGRGAGRGTAAGWCTSRPTTCSTATPTRPTSRRPDRPAHRLRPHEARRRAGRAGALPDGRYVVRTAWVYGGPAPNFVKTMVRLEQRARHGRRRRRPARLADVVGDLAAALVELGRVARPPASALHQRRARDVVRPRPRGVPAVGADPARVRPADTARVPPTRAAAGLVGALHGVVDRAGGRAPRDWRAARAGLRARARQEPSARALKWRFRLYDRPVRRVGYIALAALAVVDVAAAVDVIANSHAPSHSARPVDAVTPCRTVPTPIHNGDNAPAARYDVAASPSTFGYDDDWYVARSGSRSSRSLVMTGRPATGRDHQGKRFSHTSARAG